MKKLHVIFLAMLVVGLTSLWLLYRSRTNTIQVLTRDQKDLIIERALALKLLPTTANIFQEADKFSKRTSQKVRAAEYEEAISIVLDGLKKFPRNFELQANLAANLGDCAEVTQPSLADKMIQRSKEIFDKLMPEVEAQPKDVFFYFKNEYYYRFAQYREQYNDPYNPDNCI